MRKAVEEPHLLTEFIQVKALVLRLLDQQQDIQQLAQQTFTPGLTNGIKPKKALVNQSSQQSGRALALTAMGWSSLAAH